MLYMSLQLIPEDTNFVVVNVNCVANSIILCKFDNSAAWYFANKYSGTILQDCLELSTGNNQHMPVEQQAGSFSHTHTRTPKHILETQPQLLQSQVQTWR